MMGTLGTIGMVLMMGSWLIVPLLLVGAVVVALGVGLRSKSNPTNTAQSDRNPVEILKARYAAGEIDREAYEQARRDLES